MGLTWSLLARPTPKTREPLRIGILGAASIAPVAVTNPLKHLADGVVHAVAARDPKRARAFATRYGIPLALASYQELVDHPDIDAVYIPLPNGLHEKWAIAAIKAGKHVLCEKPVSSNAQQAMAIKSALDEYNSTHPNNRLVFAEAFHWKCHPLGKFLQSVVLGKTEWDLGEIESVEANMVIPKAFLSDSDIRFNFDLAGGSLMDACYTVSAVRFVVEAAELRNISANDHASSNDARINSDASILEATIPKVLSAVAEKHVKDDRIDTETKADLLFPGGIKAKIKSSLGLHGLTSIEFSLKITGTKAALTVDNFVAPFLYHSVAFQKSDGSGRETRKVYRESAGHPAQTTYWHQMRAFLESIRASGEGFRDARLTSVDDAVANMKTIDAIYTAAGMSPRA
ncbi:hypothetical protein HDU82_006597 [Entophlyctis luteolus]|nr:hypothetical protein HDU82_006597 [Entophlyctis luteolus]